MPDRKCVASSQNAPAVGPYSPAVVCGGMIFCSGQIPLDPATGKVVEGQIEEQTRMALSNLKRLLEGNGSGMDLAAKTTVFLKDMDDFQRMNAIYAEFFPTDPPARSTVEVARLPLDALVEVEAIAFVR